MPLADVLVDDELRSVVDEVVDSGWWSMGPRVEEFEAAFAEFTGTKHAFAVANGTAACTSRCSPPAVAPATRSSSRR